MADNHEDLYVWVVEFSVQELDEDTGQYRTDGPYTWVMKSDRKGLSVDDVKEAVVAEHVDSGYDKALGDFTWHRIDQTRVIWF